MALDVGDKRIGIALSDLTLSLVRPLETYTRRNPRQDAEYFLELSRRWNVGLVVVGLPLRLSGGEGTQARKVREFAELLKNLGLRVEFWDESFSTDRAMEFLRGRPPREKKEKKDSIAAAIILEEYLREKIEKNN